MNKTLSNVTMYGKNIELISKYLIRAKYDFDYEEFEEVTADAKVVFFGVLPFIIDFFPRIS